MYAEYYKVDLFQCYSVGRIPVHAGMFNITLLAARKTISNKYASGTWMCFSLNLQTQEKLVT